MIKFITGEASDTPPTFGDVRDDQFFVNRGGELCQKYNATGYNVIANASGEPYSTRQSSVESGMQIERILQTITKIEF